MVWIARFIDLAHLFPAFGLFAPGLGSRAGGLSGFGCFEGCSEFALKLRPSSMEVGCGISSEEVDQP